jgi:hypothetical protein
VKIKREKTLKTATVKDFVKLFIIPILKFAAKIRGWGLKTLKKGKKGIANSENQDTLVLSSNCS